MNDEQASDDSLGLPALESIDRICVAFEKAWRSGQQPRIEDYLDDSQGLHLSRLLRELLLLDVDYRRSAGETPDAKEYSTRFPEHVQLVRQVLASNPPREAGVSIDAHETSPTGSKPYHRGEIPKTIIGDVAGSRDASESNTAVVDSEHFLLKLSETGVLSTNEMTALSRNIGTGKSDSDARQLASHLVSEGKLTEFQASALLQGQPELLIDKYLILDLIDAGGMGMVFKAIHRPMNRLVALKMISHHLLASPEQVKRFQREVRVAATLEHPNVVRAYDADQSRGVHFLVMEYVRGENLAKIARRQGPLSLEQAVDCILQAATGLRYAHKHGVIHRDIKPGNLMLTSDGSVKVLDLGLANVDASFRLAQHSFESAADENADPELAETNLTTAGTVLGTVSYMAPEQSLDAKAADARSDIYSLGCTLYYLLIGEPPFHGDTVIQEFLQHRDGQIPVLRDRRPDVPESVDAICGKMLAKAPDDRFQSMAELISAIEDCEIASPAKTEQRRREREPKATVGRSTNGATNAAHPPPAPPKSHVLWGAIAAAVLVAIIYGGYRWWKPAEVGQNVGPANVVEGDDTDRSTATGNINRDSQTSSSTWAAWPADAPAPAIKPFGAETAKRHQQKWADYLGVPVEFENSIGMKFQLIPPGEFLMGTTDGEIQALLTFAQQDQLPALFYERFQSEGPQRHVVVTRPFYLGTHEVTIGQFRVFADGSDDAWDGWHPPDSLTDEHPATVISWEDANRFAEWLSQKEERSYRLPKEAEWEFACRAGTETPWHTGKDVNALQHTANVGDASLKRQDASKFWAEAWDDGFAGSAPVGGLENNAFGLYDMHGNLYEWCADWYSPDAYQSEQVDDPSGPDLGTDRVVRSGSYKDKGLMCRSAARASVTPNGRLGEVGIRVLLEVP